MKTTDFTDFANRKTSTTSGRTGGTMSGREFFAAAILTVIVAGASTSCFAQAARWREVEADNGAVFRVDLTTLFHTINGGAVVTVIEGPDEYARVTQFSFDCRGGFWIVGSDPHARMSYAPPRSVAGQISNIACTTRSIRDPVPGAPPSQPITIHEEAPDGPVVEPPRRCKLGFLGLCWPSR